MMNSNVKVITMPASIPTGWACWPETPFHTTILWIYRVDLKTLNTTLPLAIRMKTEWLMRRTISVIQPCWTSQQIIKNSWRRSPLQVIIQPEITAHQILVWWIMPTTWVAPFLQIILMEVCFTIHAWIPLICAITTIFWMSSKTAMTIWRESEPT